MNAPTPTRGDIWLADIAGDKVRPVLVMTRGALTRHLHSVIVAPVTSTIRGLPSEIALSDPEGLRLPSVANFDNVQLLSRTRLKRRIGSLSAAKLSEACRALRHAVEC